MDSFTAVAETYAGTLLELLPRSLTLSRSLSSPAQSLHATFPLARWHPDLYRLILRKNGSDILEVRPDRQTAAYAEEGMSLEVSGRTKGAALLDNEAKPRTYQNLTTQTLFNDLIAPFGFLLLHAPAPALPEFGVRKGLTLWDAFCTYTRRVYGLVPYVEGDMVRVFPPSPGNPVVLGGEDFPIVRLERVIDHYEPLSRVFVRNDEGEYIASVGNPDAAERKIERVRYLIPSGEFAAAPSWDAAQRIERSMRKLLTVRVTLPGYLGLLPGRGVYVNHPRLTEPNLLVDEASFTLDKNGARTTFVLRSTLYYQ